MKKIIVLWLLCSAVALHAQIPVEVFGGHEKTTLDIMWFRFFKNRNRENSPWLFFNRNRASVDYRMNVAEGSFLPQFGFTEAVSYNAPALKGFAPVAVAQLTGKGVFPKVGVQFVRLDKTSVFFSWVVCETLRDPNIDIFALYRCTPKLTEKIDLFGQIESLNALSTGGSGTYSFTQRLRLGLQFGKFQGGAGADLNQSGNTDFVFGANIGGFLRHEF